MTDRVTAAVPRRRRSWYQRRLRTQRVLSIAVLVVIIGGVCAQSAYRFFSARQQTQSSSDLFRMRSNPRGENDLAWATPHAARHAKYVSRIPGIYPYSVVPGGIRDLRALREIAASDRAVSRHFANFDYSRARLVRVGAPREVYVSYRIRDTIFWTRKKIRLSAGELLLTDGKITARAKCGNQISETAKPDMSDQEPETDVLDQPVAVAAIGPLPFRPHADLPAGSPMAPPLFAGGFAFPYAPIGGAPSAGCESKDGILDKRCQPHHRKPVAPEPATLFLISTGMAFIFWRFRVNAPRSVAARAYRTRN